MISIGLLGIAAVLHVVACSLQAPSLSYCTDEHDPIVKITNVTLTNAKLGEKLKINAAFKFKVPLGSDAYLDVSFALPDGTKLSCPDHITQCHLRLCNGTETGQLQLNREWKNKCPIHAGKYTAHLSVPLPGNGGSEWFIRDGNIVVTFSIKSGGKIVECVSFIVNVMK